MDENPASIYRQYLGNGRYADGSTADLVEDERFWDVRQEVLSLVRHGIRLLPDLDTGSVAVGASKFGGKPDLPDDILWPKDNVILAGSESLDASESGLKSMPFIFQLNLEQVRAFDLDDELPREGMLFSFISIPSMIRAYL